MEKIKYTTHSVERAFDVLEYIAAHPSTLAQVARQLNLTASTAYKTLAGLEARGYLYRDSGDGRYYLGARVLALAPRYYEQHPLPRIARPYLEELAAATEETAHLAMRQGLSAVLIDRVRSGSGLMFVIEPGETTVLHAGGGAKVLLAYCPEEILEQYLTRPLTRFTDNTITDPDCLLRELEQIRQRGYAESEGELTPGVRTVAAAILDDRGMALGSIGISGPTTRFRDEAVPRYAALVMAAASEVAAKFRAERGTG